MKFGKITAANVSTDALSLGGALAGGALSNGIMTFVPQEQEVLARSGMAGVGLLGAASVKGKTSTSNLVKFALLGFGIAQGSALIKHFASQQMNINENSTASQRFVGGMVGLACPCSGGALASPVINFGALKSPSVPQIGDSFSNQEVETQQVQVGAF